MANTKSIQKIMNYLREKDQAVSPSEICFAVMLQYKTVKEVLEILSMNKQITILTTGKRTLVKLEEQDQ